MFVNTYAKLVLLSLTSLAAAGEFPNCNHNNCYRAFNGDAYATVAAAFCAGFTTALTTTTSDFPSHATRACTEVAQISSVCSCAYPAPTVKKTSTTTSTSESAAESSSTAVSSSRASTAPTASSLAPSSTSSTTSTTSTTVTSLSSPCSWPLQTALIASHTCGMGTNCYRGLANIGRGGIPASDVVAFCGTYTTALHTGSAGIPAAVLSSCGTTTTRISSLCSCLVSKQGTCAAATASLPADSAATPGETRASASLASSLDSFSRFSNSSAAAPTRTFQTVPVTLAPPQLVCNEDNCLRAFIRGNGSDFCSAYTLGGMNPPPYPTYTTQCTGSTASRVSSACTCLNRPTQAPGKN